ncbi:hypothetical protein EXIGLDRAFT_57763 [Exidia glandulosa HHB12029]|uniref:Uncharacterized protein n=1 Tax=Exidia glandulosa HHB12029 TaxID=1314781 RepID=A0A165I625_EXIGL|nr:hypothetical protein EXIGLDRAFT_57763 [Exidia glandulosa HHB12029]
MSAPYCISHSRYVTPRPLRAAHCPPSLPFFLALSLPSFPPAHLECSLTSGPPFVTWRRGARGHAEREAELVVLRRQRRVSFSCSAQYYPYGLLIRSRLVLYPLSSGPSPSCLRCPLYRNEAHARYARTSWDIHTRRRASCCLTPFVSKSACGRHDGARRNCLVTSFWRQDITGGYHWQGGIIAFLVPISDPQW